MYVSTGITLSGGTSGAFAEIIDCTPPNLTRGAVDVTHQGSTAREFLPTKLIDGGTCRVRLGYNPASPPPISAAVETWTLAFPDSGTTSMVFDGFLTNSAPTGMLEDKATCDVDIKVTGAVTYSS